MKILLKGFLGEKTDRVPLWLMRQAGRYLPEYMELRKDAGSFLNLVYNPSKAAEVTVQPVRRFGMDGAILFSDILVIPQALGQNLEFETGEGPKLGKLNINELDIDDIDNVLNPIYETVRLTLEKLEKENLSDTTMIGFAGAPWTVCCYMVEGKGSRDFVNTKIFAYKNPEQFQKLIDIVTNATIHYLKKQIEAGVEAVKIFDSWAGMADEYLFEKYVIRPTKKICYSLKKEYPNVPIIGFPRGACVNNIDYVRETDINVLAIDQSLPVKFAKENLSNKVILQGNMDPALLMAGGDMMEKSVKYILDSFSDNPFIFNLGHGIIKETNPDNVARIVNLVHSYERK